MTTGSQSREEGGPQRHWRRSPQRQRAQAEAPPRPRDSAPHPGPRAGFSGNPLQRVPGSLSKPQRKRHSLLPSSGIGGSPAIMGGGASSHAVRLHSKCGAHILVSPPPISNRSIGGGELSETSAQARSPGKPHLSPTAAAIEACVIWGEKKKDSGCSHVCAAHKHLLSAYCIPSSSPFRSSLPKGEGRRE